MRCIWLWVAENARSIRALHSPGKNNVAADIPERGSARRRLELESSNCGIAVGMLRYSLGGLVCGQGQSQMPPVVLHVTERRSAAGVECARPGTVARGPALRIPSIFLPPRPPGEVPRENARMILVAPHKPNKSWFSGMHPWIRRERFDIPEWPNALSQADGLIIERPYYRGIRLVAWMLTKLSA